MPHQEWCSEASLCHSDIILHSDEDNAFADYAAPTHAPKNPGQRPEPEEAVAILVDAMLARPRDEVLQKRAIKSLMRMASKEDERVLVGQSGCIQTAITAMRMFPENSEVACNGAKFLANVSFGCDENQHRIRECRGIELLITLMKLREDDDEFHYCASLALRNLTLTSEHNRSQALKFGALENIQRSLQRFEENKNLQVQGIATVGNIACLSLETQKKVRDSGCVDVVVEAMRKHASSLSLQEHCVLALRQICFQNEPNQRLVGKLGGVELLTELMRKQQSNAQLLVEICTTLRYMCFEEDVRNILGRNGAITLVIESLGPVSDCCGGEKVALVLKALSNAIFSPQENKQIVVRCGGIDAVMDVLEKFRNGPEVVNCGLRVFRNVVDKGGVNSQLLAEANAFSFAMERAAHFKEHPGITENLCAIFLDASAGAYDEERMGSSQSELKGFVSQQLRNLTESVPVQQLGRALLAHLELEHTKAAPPERKSMTRTIFGKIRRTISEHR